jgi:hypothetical protein
MIREWSDATTSPRPFRAGANFVLPAFRHSCDLSHNTEAWAPSRMAPPNRPWFWIESLIREKAPTRPALAYDARCATGLPARTTVGLCSCGHLWNTFETGGVCPACLHQWTSTQYLSCARWSPHSDWYAR